jgi:hypothetical protein
MSAINLPVGRARRQMEERAALRHGMAITSATGNSLRLVPKPTLQASGYCAACAGPIEYGPVLRGTELYCSLECSLGSRPA